MTEPNNTRWYAVALESESPSASVRGERLESLAEAVLQLEGPFEAAGSVVSWGGLAGGPGLRWSIRAPNPVVAAGGTIGAFVKALAEVGIAMGELAYVEVMSEAYQDRWLETSEELVGVSEIARILEVSKQRVSELRGRAGFPAPAAELASGPVWRRSSLERFVSEWPRRPGRPKKTGRAVAATGSDSPRGVTESTPYD